MSAITATASTATPTMPDGSTINSNPPTRSVSLATTIPISEGSRDNILDRADLGTFFGTRATPASQPAPAQGSVAGPTTVQIPGPSSGVAQGDPHAPVSRPTPDAAAREFLANVGLSGIPPSDKRFEGKTECRGLQQEVHSLAQATAGLASSVTESRIETVEVVSDIEARITAVENRTKAATTAQHEVAHLHERVDHVGIAITRLEAQVDTAIHAVNSLVARLDTIAAPPAPIAAPVSFQAPTTHVAAVSSAPLAAAPTPPSAAPATALGLTPVALTAPSTHSVEGQFERLNGEMGEIRALLLGMKRPRSPAPLDDARNVRPHVELPAIPAATIPTFSAPVNTSAAGVYPPLVPTVPVFAPATAAAPPVAPSVPVSIPPPVSISTPVSIGPTAVNAPPALPPVDPTREVRLGPANWGKNLSGDASTVIRTVLPSAKGIMRSFRARRGADPYTVIACFESAEIASWFTPAFNAARVPPYDTIFASPNV
ncbi:hypothetical protein K438DRAFT_1930044 [Mycena galopus ATCC 62051]|nr:hypothetical protein K438DRAFT_1930044 [Mycena galopus ATCC 62051]